MDTNFSVCINRFTPLVSCIEVPGTVTGEGLSVVRALGGEEALSQALGKRRHDYTHPFPRGNMLRSNTSIFSSQVLLRFVPEDRFSKFLVSTMTPRSDVLLHVLRCKRTNTIVGVRLAGIIIEKTSFESLADFYYIPPNVDRSTKLRIETELDESHVEPLFVPPPVFTRLVAPLPYKKTLQLQKSLVQACPESHQRNFISKYKKKMILRKEEKKKQAGMQLQNILSECSQTQLSQDDMTYHNDYDNIDSSLNTQTCSSETLQDFQYLTKCNNHDNQTANYTRGDTKTSETYFVTNEVNDSKRSSTEDVSSGASHPTICNIVRRFDDDRPVCPPAVSLSVTHIDEAIIETYKTFFQQRPMWIRYHLDLQAGIRLSDWKRKHALASLCYYFSDGPWRGTMCRFGYDPKSNPESVKFQTIDFRDPYYRGFDFKNTSKASPQEPVINLSRFVQFRQARCFSGGHGNQEIDSSSKDLSHEDHNQIQKSDVSSVCNEICFRTPPSRPSMLYQFCDIDDAAVQQVLSTTPLLPKCSKESGWVPKATITQLRDIMLMKCQNMRQLSNKLDS